MSAANELLHELIVRWPIQEYDLFGSIFLLCGLYLRASLR
jgi:hypothetical protein